MQDPSNLVWMDLEMTGLEPDRDVILEIATLITDSRLEILAEGPVLAIHRGDEVLANMNEWSMKAHEQSGLVARCRESKTGIELATEATLDFVRRWVPEGLSPLCGNSIFQDRRFVRIEMPKLDAWLHYRHIDVTTIKELVRRWYPAELHAPKKRKNHLALDDIRESIEELRWYRDKVFLPLG